MEWYSALIGEVFRGGYIARGTKVLKKLPNRVINFSNPSDRALHDKIASIQKKLIDIQAHIDQNTGNDRALIPFQREFDSTKQEMEASLKQLYVLQNTDNQIPLISELYAIT